MTQPRRRAPARLQHHRARAGSAARPARRRRRGRAGTCRRRGRGSPRRRSASPSAAGTSTRRCRSARRARTSRSPTGSAYSAIGGNGLAPIPPLIPKAGTSNGFLAAGRLDGQAAHRSAQPEAAAEPLTYRRRTFTPDELIPQPHELVPRNGTPDTIAGWKALADGLLTDQCCAFHRNMEISSRYAWIYKLQPACFKWAAMAAFASHHVRLALFPLRLDTDRTGYVDIPRSLGRRKVLLTADVNTIRDDEQRHLRRHLLGPPRVRHRRRRDRTSTRSPASGPPLCGRPRRLRGDRPRTPCPGGRDGVRGGSAGGRGSHLGGQRPAPRARAARLGATQLRSPLVRVRQALLDRLGHELRGAWRAARRSRTSPRSTSTRSHEGSRTPCARRRGRGSPASTTAGVGS